MWAKDLNGQLLFGWLIWLIKHLTLDFSSGHDLMVCETVPLVGLWADSVEPRWDSFSLPSLTK